MHKKKKRGDRRGALENKRESEMVAGGLSIFFYTQAVHVRIVVVMGRGIRGAEEVTQGVA